MLIIRFLDHDFILYYVENGINIDTIVIDQVKFSKDKDSIDLNGFIGFFDWLRSEPSNIIGVRTCYFEHTPYFKLVERFPYIKTSFENRCMELLFENSIYRPELCDDQDSTNNYVFRSNSNNELLFTFSLDGLTESELSLLTEKCIRVPKENLTE